MSYYLVDAVLWLPINAGNKNVLAVLASFADHDGSNARPGMKLLKAKTSLSERTIQGHLGELETRRLIRVVAYRYGGEKTTEFELAAERIYNEAAAIAPKDLRPKSLQTPAESAPPRGSPAPHSVSKTEDDSDGDDPDAAAVEVETMRLWPKAADETNREHALRTTRFFRALRETPRDPGESDDELRQRIEAAAHDSLEEAAS